jgi:hypothetical protein
MRTVGSVQSVRSVSKPLGTLNSIYDSPPGRRPLQNGRISAYHPHNDVTALNTIAARNMTRHATLRCVSPLSALLVCAVGACHARTASSPSSPADIIGQVVEVRAVTVKSGFQIVPSTATGNDQASWGHELRIQVAGARTTMPGYDAYVHIDGMTQVAISGKSGVATPSQLEGAYVRVWFRGIPTGVGPAGTTAVARFVAIDSVGQLRR